MHPSSSFNASIRSAKDFSEEPKIERNRFLIGGAHLHDLDAHDAALVEDKALGHDIVLARVLAVRGGRLCVAVVDAENARPHRPRVVGRPRLGRLVHQLQVDHLTSQVVTSALQQCFELSGWTRVH